MFKENRSSYRLVSFVTVLCILFSGFQPVTVFARSGDSLERKFNAEWMPTKTDPVRQDQDVTAIPTDTFVPMKVSSPIETPVPIETSLPVDSPAAQSLPSADIVGPLAVTIWYVATTGDDLNSCTAVGSPCLTINGAIGKATDGDTIKVATGTYTGSGAEVVLINNSITLSGGWNTGFTSQTGFSTIDGQALRRGINVNNSSAIVIIERFAIQHGLSGLGGGGIMNNAGTITIYDTTINGNSAGDPCCTSGGGGGGIMNFGGTIILNNSTVSNNVIVGGFLGSGLLNFGTMTVNNSTISGNTGSQGIYNPIGTVTINNSTVSGNTSGGIYNGGGTVILYNTVVANNTANNCSGSPISTLGYNLIGNNSGCTFNPSTGDLVGTSMSPINPGMTPLQDNGGPTFTHALMEGSPAINAGNPVAPGSGGTACLTTDQRGISRPVGTACDIGAFEGQVPAVFVNISGNAGVAGATLNYTDGTPKTAMSDGSGNYTISVLLGWSGTVIPSKAGFSFAPVNRIYNYVVTNQTSQNYTATLIPLIQDPSFEAFTPNPYWAETSTNFGTPLCIPAFCGNGAGTAAPRTGSVWGWFGGVPVDETASLSQTINIPNGIPDLRLNFYFWIGAAASGSDAEDRFVVWIDDTPVFLANATQISSYASYTLVSVDISAYSDGASHTITFSSETTGQLVTFNLDDVTLGLPTIACDEITGSSGVAMNMQDEHLVLGIPSSNNVASVNGGSTTGVFRPGNGLLYLKNTNTTGFADVAINYGAGGDYPITGDWDGNGTDTIGIYRNGMFYLRNSNTLGFADIVVPFGAPGDQPVAGDWDGDGIDTIGVYRSSAIAFCLRNSNSAGVSDTSFLLGIPGDIGIAGDWDGDGMDTTGVFRPSNGIIFLKNANTSGFADVALNYGLSGDMPVTGDWNNDGIDTIGVYRNAQFLLRNSNTIGFADIVFALGNPGDMPIAGNWDGLP